MTYQKDGPGILKRLYLDRITSPSDKLERNKNLSCKNCKMILGVKTAYKKENRPVYRLFVGAIKKEIVSGKVRE